MVFSFSFCRILSLLRSRNVIFVDHLQFRAFDANLFEALNFHSMLEMLLLIAMPDGGGCMGLMTLLVPL
jgi:hypothetical protein